MNKYTESLIKGNNTLTKKVESLQRDIVNKEKMIVELRLENAMLNRKLKSYEAKLKEYEELLKKDPITKLSTTTNLAAMLDILSNL